MAVLHFTLFYENDLSRGPAQTQPRLGAGLSSYRDTGVPRSEETVLTSNRAFSRCAFLNNEETEVVRFPAFLNNYCQATASHLLVS